MSVLFTDDLTVLVILRSGLWEGQSIIDSFLLCVFLLTCTVAQFFFPFLMYVAFR